MQPVMILRPLDEGDAAELLRIHVTPEVGRWWDVPDEGFPWDEPESTRLTIEVDGGGWHDCRLMELLAGEE